MVQNKREILWREAFKEIKSLDFYCTCAGVDVVKSRGIPFAFIYNLPDENFKRAEVVYATYLRRDLKKEGASGEEIEERITDFSEVINILGEKGYRLHFNSELGGHHIPIVT